MKARINESAEKQKTNNESRNIMKKNIYKSLFLVPLLALSIFFSSTAYAKILNVPQVEQNKLHWCWAACSRAILLYYGKIATSQCELANLSFQNQYACCVLPCGSFSRQQWNDSEEYFQEQGQDPANLFLIFFPGLFVSSRF